MKQRKVVEGAILGRTGNGISYSSCLKGNLYLFSGTRECTAIPLEYFCFAGHVVLWCALMSCSGPRGSIK